MSLSVARSPRNANAVPATGSRRPLTGRTEVRRTRADDGSEYLAILIRKPLTDNEILFIGEFLDLIEPGNTWVYTGPGAN